MALRSRAACRDAREWANVVVGAHNCVASLGLLVLFFAGAAVLPASAQSATPQTPRPASSVGPTAPRPLPPAWRRPLGSDLPLQPGRIPDWPQTPCFTKMGRSTVRTDSWTINFGFIVSDSFTLPGGAIVKDFDIWVWELPGDTVSTIEWSITSQENGGMIFGSGTASVSDSFLSTNGFGYNIPRSTNHFRSQRSFAAATSGSTYRMPQCPQATQSIGMRTAALAATQSAVLRMPRRTR